ncbi:MAG: transposase [Euryarchaeota archaeon]|nr:transposase [Euryarchaeota archaeon]
MAKKVCFCISLVQPLVRSIKLILFDRGFYSKELILTLANADYPYLIFVPKNKKVKKELVEMEEAEKNKIHYEFKLNKNKTVLRGETTLALLKQIIDPSNGKVFDWAFATNQDEIDLEYIIPTYKGRWRIETGFRVQDEASIKSKSKDMKIRFFVRV